MAVFPLFVDLKGKGCIVLGGGRVAARKINTLLEFEADITVISPRAEKEIIELAQKGKIKYMKREYIETDMEDSFLAVAATSKKDVNEKICHDANERNILVNSADNLKNCTFIFPSTIKREDLVIGISTSGNYPALSKSIRQEIERLLDEGFDLDKLSQIGELRKSILSGPEGEGEKREALKKIMAEKIFKKY